ncbi:MAG: peptidoglycan-binding domain-containing protein [Chthoniobacterales bacterium]
MKIKPLLTLAVAVGFIALAGASQAGWGGCGPGWGGGWRGGGYGWGGGGWNRGGCGPGWGGGGWGWGGPSVNLSFWNPPPVYYRPVYVYPAAQPVVYETQTVYAQPVYYRPKAAVDSGNPLVRVQIRLTRLGYYQGPVDGNFGPMTSRALREYQIDYGLPLTGRVDRRTIVSLGV